MLPILPLLEKDYWLKASVSAVATAFDPTFGCPRKIFYSKILGHWGESSFASNEGTTLHAIAEHLARGEDVSSYGPRHIQIAQAGVGSLGESLPLDIEKWGIETRMDVACFEQVPFTMRVDLHRWDKPLVLDFKFTGSKRFYSALSRAELSADLQMGGYAYNLYKEDPPTFVSVGHINVYRGPGKVKVERVNALMTWTQAEDIWFSSIVEGARKLQSLYKQAVPENSTPLLAHAERVPYGHVVACKRYKNGCAFKDICSASPDRRKKTPLPIIPQDY